MEKDDKKMGWIRVLLILLPYLIIVGVFQFVAYIIIGYSPNGTNTPKSLTGQTVVSIATLLGTLSVLHLFIKMVEKREFLDLGLSLTGRIKDILIGILAGFLIMAIAFFILLFLNELQFLAFNFNAKSILFSSLVFIAVSIDEELLFRGYIQRNLMYSFNDYIALLISAVLFALAHGFNPNFSYIAFIGIFFAGILLGISYLFTKNLWFPIALHFSWNLFQTYFGFNVSGQEFYSIIEFQIAENNIINGGDFGFEASILSLFLQLILILVIFFHYKKQNIRSVKKAKMKPIAKPIQN